MLNKIRIASTSIIARLFFALIAVAFVGWGTKDALQDRKDFNLVTFSTMKNISENDFLRAKGGEIERLQKAPNTNFTEEKIKEFDVNNLVIRKLIYQRSIDYLLDYYQFDINQNTCFDLIKQLNAFKNTNKEFDINLFKLAQRDSNLSDTEYVNEIKRDILQHAMIDIFLQALPIPKAMSDNMLNYLAEERVVEIIKADLGIEDKNNQVAKATAEELKEFYQNHQDQFVTLESRDFSYIKILFPHIKALAEKQVTETKLNEFYKENKSDFEDKAYLAVKSQVKEKYIQFLAEKLSVELTKNIEDSVAAGSSLMEITEKYNLPAKADLLNVSQLEIPAQTSVEKFISENGFRLQEGEISYPLDLPNNEGFLIIETTKIIPSYLPKYEQVSVSVQHQWKKQQLIKLNLDVLEEFAKTSQVNRKYPANISKTKKALVRANLDEINNLPAELLVSIFQTEIGNNTSIIRSNDKAYFANVKSSKINKATLSKITSKYAELIDSKIKDGILEEMLGYIILQNNMHIDKQSRVLN